MTDQSPSQRGLAGSHDDADVEPDSTPPPPPAGDDTGNESDDETQATHEAAALDATEAEAEAAPTRRIARRVGIIAAAVVAALGITYGVLYLIAGDSLSRGATVAGVDVGGMTAEEAEATLAEQLPAIVDGPVHLTTAEGETTFEVVPSEAGLTIDIPATVAAVPGGSANPVSLVQSLLGTGSVEPVPAVDGAAVTAAVEDIAEGVNAEPVNGSVAFESGEVVTSEPQNGARLDVEASAERLVAAYFGDGSTELPIGDVALVVDEVAPAVTADEVDRAVDEFAQPAMSAPVTVAAGDETADIPTDMIAQALSMSPNDEGVLRPDLDSAALADVAHDVLAEIGQEGKDATVTIEGGAPVVVPAEAGQGVSAEALGEAVLPALTESGDARRATVELTDVEPELTAEDAEALGVTEVVSEFTTNFPHAEYRNVNIGTAAASIDNTLLQPGDEFSLNDIVGERTEANGYMAGTIISGGRLEESLGGGVSQVATTTFHAAYVAGLDDVEHWPHSIYFDRYPVGQEATVAWGAKDMRFANDTPHGVVVDTSFSASSPGNDGSLTVRIWSTQHFKVETSVSDRYDYTSPRTIYDTSANCAPQGGSQGFSITSYRKVWGPDGTLVKDETDPWAYNPNHKVVCGEDPDQPDQ